MQTCFTKQGRIIFQDFGLEAVRSLRGFAILIFSFRGFAIPIFCLRGFEIPVNLQFYYIIREQRNHRPLIKFPILIIHIQPRLSFPANQYCSVSQYLRTLLPFLQTRAGKACFLITALHGIDDGRQDVARIALRCHQSSDAQYPEPLWHYLYHRSCRIAHLPAMGCSAGKKYPEENASMEFCRQKDEKSKQIMRTFKEKHYLCI